MNELLDFNPAEEKERDDFSENVKWWEKKRLLYNLLVGACGMVNIILKSGLDQRLVFPVLLFGISANVFYSLGPMTDAWDNYYFKGRLKMRSYRLPLFVLGTLLSILITVMIDPTGVMF